MVYYGGRASGKSYAVAQALLIRGSESRLRILCTREVQNTIKDSVHKLLKDLIDKHGLTDYVVNKETIKNTSTGTEFIFKGLKHNTNEIKSTEGIDICWVEEAQSITKASLDILTPTIRKPGSQIIFTFNRFNELDPVYVEFVMNKPPKTLVKHVNYDVLEKAGLLPDVIKDEIEKDREDVEVFAHKWLGEPLSQQERSIISRDKILQAMQREIEDDGAEEYGVDVARMGNDRTVFWRRKGLKTLDHKSLSKLKTTELCDALEQFMGFDEDSLLKVDDTGVGGGVTDEMEKRGYNVIGVNFGEKATEEDKYPNYISEAWFYLESIIDTIQLPFDSNLLMELSTRSWNQDTKGKRRVESKIEYKKRGFRSPDLADAAIICYATPKSMTLDDIAL
jgi:phage terminase large subunit